jgi:hypothetical protein
MTNTKTEATVEILAEVLAERRRQTAKWGEQNHPDGTGAQERPLMPILRLDSIPGAATADRTAAAFKAQTDASAGRGVVTWRDILLEEVFEALAESEPTALRAELVQAAAVAVQWVETIDRRAARAVRNPDVGPRCPACRMGLPTHEYADPQCTAYNGGKVPA